MLTDVFQVARAYSACRALSVWCTQVLTAACCGGATPTAVFDCALADRV
jgi:hypothetical protein